MRTSEALLSQRLAQIALDPSFYEAPADVRQRARHCLLDWVGVTLAGCSEPLARIVTAEYLSDGGAQDSLALGSGQRGPAAAAAMINGTSGHALDYDDVILALSGHPTAVVAPAVLALAERERASGREVSAALIAGIEVCSRMGRLLGDSHYARGWHATGTLGAFGAAAAAARLLKLSPLQTAHALCITASQASGLKIQFGTMCKPLQAGHAASVGVRAASLAARGYAGRIDALEGPSGFMQTHAEPSRSMESLGAAESGFHLRSILFKYHASCYGTHASIEAARDLRTRLRLDGPQGIRRIGIRVPESALGMCAIPEPKTGLEAKFSLRHLVGAALAGVDTADLLSFTDRTVANPDVLAWQRLVEVRSAASFSMMQAEVRIEFDDGRVEQAGADAGVPASDLHLEQQRLHGKFVLLASPVLRSRPTSEAAALILGLEEPGAFSGLLQILSSARPSVPVPSE